MHWSVIYSRRRTVWDDDDAMQHDVAIIKWTTDGCLLNAMNLQLYTNREKKIGEKDSIWMEEGGNLH